jgi:hypothetical protein
MPYTVAREADMTRPDTVQLLPLPPKSPSLATWHSPGEQKTEVKGSKLVTSWSHVALHAGLLSTLLVPPIILAVWWSRVYGPQHLQLWRSAPIGGEFEQIVAKAIDVVSSAILAPLAMALVGRIWFQYARIVATSESNIDQKGTRLDSLLELSVTSSGTYDPWKLWALFRAARLRLSLVAVLALLAAVSTSLFVNIIAYEAFQTTRPFENDRKAMLTSCQGWRLAST